MDVRISLQWCYAIFIEEFCNYLQSKRFVIEKQTAFYAVGATQYLQYCNSQEDQTKPEKC